ncbi:MAG: protein-tyrosine-phosphatase [Bacteroidia bacterium]|jgi:hypothetical protein|nr:protein-tyrosine-phosphatase [Bacteroidia bacterium]
MKKIITILTLFSLTFSLNAQTKLNKKLQRYCSTLEQEFTAISVDQKKELEEIGDYIFEKFTLKQEALILFICTHNSRRSHLGQIWLQTAAAYYGINNIKTYSGGTEATAFNYRAALALERAGFNIAKQTAPVSESANQVQNIPYQIGYAKSAPSMIVYSKKYNDINNPKQNFLAVMVCSEADKTCPNVDGAELRIAMPYEDPKYFDNTPAEMQKYDERCRQIARDQFYIMYYLKKKLILQNERSLN